MGLVGIVMVGALLLSARTLASSKQTDAPASPANTLDSPEMAPLAKLNYLHTEGSKILDASGNQVKITGVSWFGFETDTLAPHGLWARNWQEMMDEIVKLGYNTIRLPFSNELFNPDLVPQGIDTHLNPDLKGLNGLQILDKFIAGAGQRGLKIILDQHRPNTDSQSKMWYSEDLSEQQWIDDWKFLAKRYWGNDTVIGADLHNEPAGDCTWGTGDPKTDWADAATRAGNAILDINPYWLIVVEGIEKTEDDFGNVLDWYWMGGSLQNVRMHAVQLKVPNRLVYSAHDYGPDVYPQAWFSDPDFPDNLPGVWDHHWGFIAKEGIAPVILGEFGGKSMGNDPEGIWQRSLIKYLKENNIGYLYWSFNGNSGDTGGLLKDDWTSIEQEKQAALSDYQGAMMTNVSPNTVDTTVAPPPRPTVKPLKLLQMDTTHDDWTKVMTPVIHVANKTLQPVDIGGYEARYWYTADGAASENLLKDQVVEIRSVTAGDRGIDARAVKAEIVADPNYQRDTDPVYYVKLTFAPGVIVPARGTVAVALQIHNKDYRAQYQPNDYSRREYHWQTEWDHIALYHNGQLVFGMEPQQYEQQEKQKQLDLENKLEQTLKGKK